MPPHTSITAGVQRFTRTKTLAELIEVARLVVRQGRALELAYGGYCLVCHRPSPVYPADDAPAVGRILARSADLATCAVLSRRELEAAYGAEFPVAALPPDFALARRESVLVCEGCLILGEYGEGSRIACLTSRTCRVDDYYRGTPLVRHIHAIQGYGPGRFLVSTGDGCKFLDQWALDTGRVRFERRLQSLLAGYTAAIELDGQYWFGSDFSRRPNFIATLVGTKYFFPEKAYAMHVAAFHASENRYLVAINKELEISGGRRTLSVFDTRTRRFVYCDFLRS